MTWNALSCGSIDQMVWVRRWIRWMVKTNEPDWRIVLMNQIASRGIRDQPGTRWEGVQRVMKNGRCHLAVIKVFLIIMQDWICIGGYLSAGEMNHLLYNSNASIHVQKLFPRFNTSDWRHSGWCTNIYKLFEWLNWIILIVQHYLFHLKKSNNCQMQLKISGIIGCQWGK